jgi:hypothetical protein
VDRERILSRAHREVQNGVNILHIKGTPYEMGYQHGYLLADGIDVMINRTLFATAAYVALQTGTDAATAMRMLKEGQKMAEPYLPAECREEMEGIVQGARDAGINVSLEQIMLWNTNYDQWCIYVHPHFWQGCMETGSAPLPGTGASGGGGCSSFSAWDDWAGYDGRLIFGKNEDNFDLPGQEENRFLVIADPDNGIGHCFMTYPGMIGLDGGFNELGIEMMTQLNSMQQETMEGCGIGVFTRLLLTHAEKLDDVIRIYQENPRCTGIAYHVADARARQAVVIETSSEHVCLRWPERGVNALWQSNHSNCYPGWMGYTGYNMVSDQAPVNELRDISSIEAWQTSLKDPYNFYVQAPSRFERYRQLIYEHRGNIDVETAKSILCDCFDPYTKMTKPRNFPSWTNNILCTICAMYPDFTFEAEPPLGIFKARVVNMWSMIAYPETGDFRLASKGYPAQYGGYERFNLHELLGRR